MVTRDTIIKQAYHECMKEMYAKAQPSTDWDQIVQDQRDGKITKDTLIYNRHYLSQDEFMYILDKYVKAYRLQDEWSSNMDTLINYINDGGYRDKWIDARTDENGSYHPGHRDYENVLPLNKQILNVISKYGCREGEMYDEICNTINTTIEGCKNYYKFDREYSSFSAAIALGVSPTSNSEVVKEYWKTQGVDLEIEERNPLLFWEKDYYGDEFEDVMKYDFGEDWEEYWYNKWKNK